MLWFEDYIDWAESVIFELNKGHIWVIVYSSQSVNQLRPQQGRLNRFHEQLICLKETVATWRLPTIKKGWGEIQLDEMNCDSWYRELLRWLNGFSVTAEDNELYSISLRGQPTLLQLLPWWHSRVYRGQMAQAQWENDAYAFTVCLGNCWLVRWKAFIENIIFDFLNLQCHGSTVKAHSKCCWLCTDGCLFPLRRGLTAEDDGSHMGPCFPPPIKRPAVASPNVSSLSQSLFFLHPRDARPCHAARGTLFLSCTAVYCTPTLHYTPSTDMPHAYTHTHPHTVTDAHAQLTIMVVTQ